MLKTVKLRKASETPLRSKREESAAGDDMRSPLGRRSSNAAPTYGVDLREVSAMKSKLRSAQNVNRCVIAHPAAEEARAHASLCVGGGAHERLSLLPSTVTASFAHPAHGQLPWRHPYACC